jgi:hypothetical protein
MAAQIRRLRLLVAVSFVNLIIKMDLGQSCFQYDFTTVLMILVT